MFLGMASTATGSRDLQIIEFSYISPAFQLSKWHQTGSCLKLFKIRITLGNSLICAIWQKRV